MTARRLGLRLFGTAGVLFPTASCHAESSFLPPISATSTTPTPLAPPVLRTADGASVKPRLLQVQAVFRHGARLPVSDEGADDETGCAWSPADADKAALLSKFKPVRLHDFGSGDATDAARLFPPVTAARTGGLRGGAPGGALTPLGLRQAVELGAEYRARYVDHEAASCAAIRPHLLLPAQWASARRLVVTRSTRVERTVYTASGVLNGLYPSADGTVDRAPDVEIELSASSPRVRACSAQPCAARATRQPTGSDSMRAGASQHEYLVLNDAMSPRLRELFTQGLRLSSASLDEAQRRVISHVEAKTGWLVDGPASGWKLVVYRDWYTCRRAHGKPVPEPVDAIAPELDAATARQMHAIFEGGAQFTDSPAATRTEALRLVIGRLAGAIVRRLSQPDGVLHLYSGHDWSVTPLLMCMIDPHDPLLSNWPPFCSNLAVELWSSRAADTALPRTLREAACDGAPGAQDEGRYVRVVYNGQPVRLACAPDREVCTLAEFKAMLRRYVVEDFAAESRASGAEAVEASQTGFNAEQPRRRD
jgi:hypothetical protein